MSVFSTLNSPLYTTFPLFAPLLDKFLGEPTTALHSASPESGRKKTDLVRVGWVGSERALIRSCVDPIDLEGAD
jgi:hypothetical protein